MASPSDHPVRHSAPQARREARRGELHAVRLVHRSTSFPSSLSPTGDLRTTHDATRRSPAYLASEELFTHFPIGGFSEIRMQPGQREGPGPTGLPGLPTPPLRRGYCSSSSETNNTGGPPVEIETAWAAVSCPPSVPKASCKASTEGK